MEVKTRQKLINDKSIKIDKTEKIEEIKNSLMKNKKNSSKKCSIINPIIETKNIYKIYNKNTNFEVEALKNINLKIWQGEFVIIIGNNGAGKSTLLNIISGFEMPDNGEIIIENKNITKLKPYKRSKFIGRLFQKPDYNVALNLTVEENLSLMQKKGPRGFSYSLDKKKRYKIYKILNETGLDLFHFLKVKAGNLSGGQKQTLALLMTIITKPSILLLDEHTSALDPKNAKLVLDLTKFLVKKFNITTIMVTHNIKDALNYGDRLIMMKQGKIIKENFKSTNIDNIINLFYN